MHILDQASRMIGKTIRDAEILKSQGGLLPQVERSRGSMSPDIAYISNFTVNERNRKLTLNLEFYPIIFTTTGAQGAFDFYIASFTHTAQPRFIDVTTPGNLLLAFIATQANSALHSIPDTPLFNEPTAGQPDFPWTIDVQQDAYNTDTIQGPPGAIQVVLAHRLVQPGEITTTPLLVTPVVGANNLGCWLYEIQATDLPTDITVINTTIADPQDVTLGAKAGLAIGFLTFQQVDFGDIPDDVFTITGDQVQSNALNNEPNHAGHGWFVPWVWIGQLAGGGALKMHFGNSIPYGRLGLLGVSFTIPNLIGNPLPPIPWPANQIGFSSGGGDIVTATDLYASGVRVFIDGQDISQYVFGSPSGVVDLSNNKWDNIDLTLWVKTPGQHALVVTCDVGSVDVDSRFEVI